MGEFNRAGKDPLSGPSSTGLITRQKEPRNLETPFDQPDRHDPNNGTYVINHPLRIDVFVLGPGGE
jgi:hypothetical protein